MKKIFVALVLLCMVSYAQNIPVYGDTTDLKLSYKTSIVLLEQYGGTTWDNTGGGLFHLIDSTYSEGAHAFNSPISGKQWARIGAFGTMTATKLTLTGDLVLDDLTIGENVFTTTGETDTVTITGALATDTYIITGQFTSAIDQQDILQWEALAGKLVVHRMASGESALKYSWLRIPTP